MKKVIPVIQEAFEQHRFPRELVAEVAGLGLLGSSLEGYDCAGLNSVCYGLICQELERGDSGLRSFCFRTKQSRHVSDFTATVPKNRNNAGCRPWPGERP